MIQTSSSVPISDVYLIHGCATVNSTVNKAKTNTGKTGISLVQAALATIQVILS